MNTLFQDTDDGKIKFAIDLTKDNWQKDLLDFLAIDHQLGFCEAQLISEPAGEGYDAYQEIQVWEPSGDRLWFEAFVVKPIPTINQKQTIGNNATKPNT
tara:strand:+ start:640 stop:936 length:297 start_codon:yes stop_codon:yes gene_type:complete